MCDSSVLVCGLEPRLSDERLLQSLKDKFYNKTTLWLSLKIVTTVLMRIPQSMPTKLGISQTVVSPMVRMRLSVSQSDEGGTS